MTRIARALAAALGLLGSVTGTLRCYDVRVGPDCASFCLFADRCGMLPSPLGADYEACLDHCSLTDPEPRRQVTGCFPGGGPYPTSGSMEQAWCGEKNAVCEEAAACLTKALPDRAIVGATKARVVFAVCPAQVVKNASQADCPGAGLTACPSLNAITAETWCKSVQAFEVRVRVEQRGRTISADVGECTEVLGRATSFTGLEAGSARAVVEIRGATTDAAQTCHVVYGARTLLRAGDEEAELQVALPQWRPGAVHWQFSCEATDALCSDGLDNDGDGSFDCADLDCQGLPVCSAPTVSACGGGDGGCGGGG